MRVKFRDTTRIRSYNGKKNQCTLHKRNIQNKEPSAKGSKQITHKKTPSIISFALGNRHSQLKVHRSSIDLRESHWMKQ